MTDVTRILDQLSEGDEHAAERLFAVVYEELRRVAADKMARETPGQTLQATALVHEAYLRLVGDERSDWKSRQYFFAASAEAMRRILVERARRRARLKHGGDRQRIDLDQAEPVVDDDTIDLLALDEALAKLAAEDARKAELVKLRYFTGLTLEQSAATLSISRATADRWWSYAKAFLYYELDKGAG